MADNATYINSTTNGDTGESPTPTTDLFARIIRDPAFIPSAAGGGALVLIIIILLLACWRRSKRSKKKPPPTLPDPYDLPRAPSFEQPSSGCESTDQDSNYLVPVQYIWEMEEPVIHSSEPVAEEHRVSYFLMKQPARPISISPPSPQLGARNLIPRERKVLPPVPCKSTTGYINLPNNNMASYHARPIPPIKPSDTSATPPRKPSDTSATPPIKPSDTSATPPRKPSDTITTPLRNLSDTIATPPRKPSDTSVTPPRKPSAMSVTPPRKPSDMSVTPPRKPSDRSVTPPRKTSDTSVTPPRKSSDTSITPLRKPSDTTVTQPRKFSNNSVTPSRKPSDTSLAPPSKYSETSSAPPRKPSNTSLAPTRKPSDTSLAPPRKLSDTSLAPPRKPSGGSLAPPSKPSETSASGDNVDNGITFSANGQNHEGYTNFQEILMAEQNDFLNSSIDSKMAPSDGFFSSKLLESELPFLLISNKVNTKTQNTQDCALKSSGDTGSGHGEELSSSENEEYADSYVNVDQRKTLSPVKEFVVIDLSKSSHPEIAGSPVSMASSRPRTRPQIPKAVAKSKSIQNKNKISISDAETNDDRSFEGRKNGQDNHDHAIPKQRSLTDVSESIAIDTYGNMSSININFPRQFLTVDSQLLKTKTKTQGQQAREKHKQRSKSHCCHEDTDVYQNCQVFSVSESKLSQPCTDSPTGIDIPAAVDKARSGEAFESVFSRSPLKDAKAETSTENLQEIRSKLRKIN